MNRRDLFAVLGSVAIGWPFAARAAEGDAGDRVGRL
jgi:hypothetical protein